MKAFVVIRFDRKDRTLELRISSKTPLSKYQLCWFAMAADEPEIYGYYYDNEEDRGLLDPAWERQQKKVR